MAFPVVMHGCESWTIKEAEHWRIDAFKLWCWRRLLRAPWTARRSSQSVLKEINLEYSLERLMLRLKLQYFGHLMWRANSLEKTLMLGKIKAGGEGNERGWDRWMASLTQWTRVWETQGDGEGQGSLECCIHRIKKKSDTTEQLKNNNKWPTSASSQVHRCPHSNGHFPHLWIYNWNEHMWQLAEPLCPDPWDKSYHSKECLGSLWNLLYPLSQDIKSKVIFNFPFCHSWGNGRD